MARVFVTGSADGLGKMAAELLIEKGHKVVLHARSAARADETREKIAGAEDIVVGDLSSIAETKSVAEQVNKLGGFDAVIHNVAPVRCFDTALQSRDHNPSCLGWPAKTMPWQTGHAPGPRMNEVEQTGE